MKPLSPYQLLVSAWRDCAKCALAAGRKQVVFARGSLPARVLFVGEGPGDSEDVLGQPFVGPAGQLLDKQIAAALGDLGMEAPRMAWFNIVGCIPKDEDGRKRGEPWPAEIEACAPRLDRFLRICAPDLIICVGQIAGKEAKNKSWAARCQGIAEITHPAAILKADISQRGLMYQRAVVQLSDAFASLQ